LGILPLCGGPNNQHDTQIERVTRNILNQDKEGIKIEKGLEGHIGKCEEEESIKVEAGLPEQIAEVLKVQAKGAKPGQVSYGGMQVSTQCLFERREGVGVDERQPPGQQECGQRQEWRREDKKGKGRRQWHCLPMP
jgi:hypothetical protein